MSFQTSRNSLSGGCRSIEFLSVRCLIYYLLFFLSLYLFVNYRESSDFYVHIRIMEDIEQGHLVVPHFLFHLMVIAISKVTHVSFFYIACLVCACFVTISMGSIEFIVRHYLKGKYSDYFLLFVSFALMLVSAIYFPLINKSPYLGIWSPNPWHNPTYLIAKPLVLLLFYWYALEITKGTYFEKRLHVVRTSILLAVCTLIKPNFVLAFIPAAFVFSFFTAQRMTLLLRTGMLILPTIGVLVFQFLFTYFGNAAGDSSVQFCFLDVWQLYTRSALVALGQGVALPVVVLIAGFPRNRKDGAYVFSWVVFIAGFLISALLCESGGRAGHANFIWTYMFCLHILFVYSVVNFLQWASDAYRESRIFRMKVFSCITVFLFHLLSGIYYIGYLLSGHLL